MEEVLKLVEEKQHEFSHLPLFEFLRNREISPRERLNFGPSFAIFAMNFRDLNTYILKRECSEDNTIQTMINQHAREDAQHWEWILEDFDKLGFNYGFNLNDALTIFWGEKTRVSRQHFYQIMRLIFESKPILQLVIIEAIEATGNVFFSALAEVAKELQNTTGEEYRYYGKCHLTVETGHTMGTLNFEEILYSISLTREEKEKAFFLVDKIFAGFTELLDEYYAHAMAQVRHHLQGEWLDEWGQLKGDRPRPNVSA